MQLQNFMFNSREDIREYAALLYAIIVVSGETSQTQLEIVKELAANVQSQVLYLSTLPAVSM